MKEFPNHYPHLFSPYTIRNTTFKNRIYTAPQGGVFNVDYIGDSFTLGNNLSEFGAVYFGNKARGGAGFVESMEVYVDDQEGIAHPHQVVLHGDRSTPTLMRYTDYIRTYGAIPSMLLASGGADAKPQFNQGRLPKGPIQTIMPDGVQVLEMTEDDMFRLAEQFAEGAKLAKSTGFGAVTLHCGHSWLMYQFLSPLENQRKDKYGGSLENRARFPILLIDAVRKAVGDQFVINMRISVEEMRPGGMTKEDTLEFLRMVEGKVDIVNCSTSSRRAPEGRVIVHPTRYRPEGAFIHLAEFIKKSGIKMAVSGVGGILTPAYADWLIAEGMVDFVGLNRAFISDPDWGEKARSGKADEIRPCIRCLRCLDVRNPRRMVCTVNPDYGQWPMRHKYFNYVSDVRNIAVIGGGPAGIQAALTAAQSGHRVTLFEKGDKLGGKLSHTDHISFKKYLRAYRDWSIRQVEKSPNITIQLGTEATSEQIKSGNFDTVIVAIGTEVAVPPIPGIDKPLVIDALTAYENEHLVKDSVVIIGGGSVGVEAAIHYAQGGKTVTVVEMSGALAADLPETERYDTLHFFRLHGCEAKLNCTCSRITDEGIYALDPSGEEFFLPAETVIVAAGMKVDLQKRDSFDHAAYDVIKVGDCIRPGNLMDAVRTAHESILRINTTNSTPWN